MTVLIKEILLKETANDPTLSAKLATIADCKVPAINKFKNDPDREFENFSGLLKIIRYVKPEHEKEIMNDYLENINPNKKSARYLLEYLSCNRMLPELKNLISKMKTCNNTESKEWATTYEIQYMWQNDYYILDIDKFKKSISKLKINNEELSIFANLMKVNAYYYTDFYRQAYELSTEIAMSIRNMTPGYLKETFTVRLNEVLSYINLRYLNNIEDARLNAQYVIDNKIGDTFEAFSYMILGQTYFYESFDKSLEYMNKSAELYERINRNDVKGTLSFDIELLKIVWNKADQTEFMFETNRLIKAAKKGEIVQITETIEDHYKNYIIGIRDNSIDSLLQSMILFLKKGDTFRANLPKIELKRKGFSDAVLNELINFHNLEGR